jgi:type II secretory pathway pseudopilin PulG
MGLLSAYSARRDRSSEAGESLVELMITIAIMGVAMVAVLGGIWTSIRVADYHRKTANADVVLRNFAEVLQASSGAYQYIPCATLSGALAYPPYTPLAPNSGYAATITKIEYLTGYNASDQPTWQVSTSGCPAGGDRGAQRLTLKSDGPVSDPKVRGVETVTIVKRDARGEL